MRLVEVSKTVDIIVDALFFSTKKEQVEDIFTRNNITDKADKIQLLRLCMNVLDTSNSNETLSIDEEYSDELEIFLNGKWRFLL